MKELAKLIGTSLSNLYNIINDGLITTLDYELRERVEFSSTVAFDNSSGVGNV